MKKAKIVRDKRGIYRKEGLAFVTKDGTIFCNPVIRAEPWEWARAIAHCLLHLAMGHFQKKERFADWNIACDFIVEKFLSDFSFGKPLYQSVAPAGFSDEEKLYRLLGEMKDKSKFTGYGTSGVDASDMIFGGLSKRSQSWHYFEKPPDWPKIFAQGLAYAVSDAVEVVSEIRNSDNGRYIHTSAHQARQWFVTKA